MIFVEGKPDKVLLHTLGFSNSIIKIAGSKGAVCNELRKKTNIKGVVDEDPGMASPAYMNSLSLIFEDKNIKELEDKHRLNRLIIIRPYLESWVVKFCNESNIDLRSYFLPDNVDDLKKVINYRLPKFERLLNDNNEVEALQKLKRFLNNN